VLDGFRSGFPRLGRDLQPKLRNGSLTRAQALRGHKRKWGAAGAWIHRRDGHGAPRHCRNYLPKGKLDYPPSGATALKQAEVRPSITT
jgi:hypothetical protein